MTSPDAAARRASRLLRWYPRAWRSRYGEEFAELLIAEISERPRSPARTADVARGGIEARLAGAGFRGCTLDASCQVRASLTALGCCAAVFAGFGAAMWSQLTVGWQWSEPDTTATTVAVVVMSAAMLALAVLALAAAVPVLCSAGSRLARGRCQGLLGPAALVAACAVILFVGGRHFGNGWPGTGGHPWARQGLVPGGVAAFSWASTLSVSSYWAHPGALAGFPAAELAWMALSPVAVAGLVGGAAAVVAAALTGAELISRGILPGQGLLDALDGACSVPGPAVTFSPPGPSSSGTFYSAARRRMVGYTIAYPPRHRARDELPLVVMLHGYGGNHAGALVGMSPAQAVALRLDGRPLAPMAMVTVDGGNGYWNAHPGDDPGAMVIGELIPLCRRLGLGRSRIATMGISMGGYGALLLAEKHPHLIAAVAAISPAIWTSCAQAHAANAGAYASAAAFAADDAVTHAPALARIPVRVASGYADPFYPGVQALARALPPGSVVDLAKGCHTDAFFAAQQPPSLAFLARHLAG